MTNYYLQLNNPHLTEGPQNQVIGRLKQSFKDYSVEVCSVRTKNPRAKDQIIIRTPDITHLSLKNADMLTVAFIFKEAACLESLTLISDTGEIFEPETWLTFLPENSLLSLRSIHFIGFQTTTEEVVSLRQIAPNFITFSIQ